MNSSEATTLFSRMVFDLSLSDIIDIITQVLT